MPLKSWPQTRWIEPHRHVRSVRRTALHLCFAILCVFIPALAPAGDFPPGITLEKERLALVGDGTARYARIIPVYDIALYAGAIPESGHLLDPGVPKRLDIIYRVPIRAGDLSRAAEKILSRQHPKDDLEHWWSRINALHDSYRDVQTGDRYTLSYLPQRGVWLEYNGERIISLQDDDFAALYFGIWLGDKPLSESLRLQLISGWESS